MKYFFYNYYMRQIFTVISLVMLCSLSVLGQTKAPMRAIKDANASQTIKQTDTPHKPLNREEEIKAVTSRSKQLPSNSNEPATSSGNPANKQKVVVKAPTPKTYAHKKRVRVMNPTIPTPKTLDRLQEEARSLQDKIAYLQNPDLHCTDSQKEIETLKIALQRTQMQIKEISREKQ